MRQAGIAALVLALTAAFYMVLIDTVSPPELYAMCGILVLAVIAFEVSRRQGVADATIRPAWLLRAWRPISNVPAHIVLVSVEAVSQLFAPKPARGRFRAVPFRGGEQGPDLGRYALTESLGSLTPNTIVIGVDSDTNLLLVHQLRRQGGRDELDVLRLG
jgi:multisubunit Na+/H+ antiporter MnhE subunit